MSFDEILRKIVDPVPGALAGAIMGADGIPLAEYARGDAELDLTAVAVEFHSVLEQASKVAGAVSGPGAGGIEELMLRTRAHQLVFRQIDDEYFAVIALEPDGMVGKARYLLGTLLWTLQEEL